MVMEGDLTWGGEYTIQYANDLLWNCIPKIYIILLTIPSILIMDFEGQDINPDLSVLERQK